MYSQERLIIVKSLSAKQIKYMTMLIKSPHTNGRGIKKKEKKEKPTVKTKNKNFK